MINNIYLSSLVGIQSLIFIDINEDQKFDKHGIHFYKHGIFPAFYGALHLIIPKTSQDRPSRSTKDPELWSFLRLLATLKSKVPRLVEDEDKDSGTSVQHNFRKHFE